jgi:transposase InsO family protein
MSCQVRKPLKSHVIPTAIISLGFMTRLQMDLVDMRTRPDGESKWILHCRDHFTKYSWAYALPSKEAQHVAKNLLQLFFQFGPCKILQSDNGKEFTAQVIKDMKIMWPGLVILNGRPRHPQSQGLVERGNSTLCDILGKLMQDRDTTHWTHCLLPAVYSMNTSLAQGIKHTPFEVVFGQKPRLNMVLWQSIADQGIEDEEDLPTSIRMQLEETPNADVTQDEGKI